MACATMQFGNGITANVISSCQCNLENTVTIFGDKGKIHIKNPWISDGCFQVFIEKKEPELIVYEVDKPFYCHEVDTLGMAVAKNMLQASSPAMTWKESLAQQRTVDKWRKAVGVCFESDDKNWD